MDRGAWWATVHGITELDMSETAEHTHTPFYLPHQATQFWHLQKDLCNLWVTDLNQYWLWWL